MGTVNDYVMLMFLFLVNRAVTLKIIEQSNNTKGGNGIYWPSREEEKELEEAIMISL